MTLLFLACTSAVDTVAIQDHESGAPADTGAPVDCGTWASVGHPFILGYCTSCHSSRLPAADRYGAPEGVDFDTLANVQAQAALLSERALGADPDMPPRGGVSAEERAGMAAWLACGAPGDEAPMPMATGDDTLLRATVLTGAVVEADGVLALTADEGGLPWSSQVFVVDGDGVAALLESERFEDGVVTERTTFEPPLPVYDPHRASLEAEIEVVREGLSTSTAAEVWTVTRTVVSDPDPRMMDDAPVRVDAEGPAGTELVWWFSTTRMLVGQGFASETGEWALVLHQNPAPLRVADDAFPIEDGGSWASRAYFTTEAP